MTAISTAYDTLISAIEAALPNHMELINALSPETNDDLSYQAAFGIAFGDGENTNKELARVTARRLFSVTLTRKIYKGDLSRSSFSVSEKRAAEKALFEDLHTLIRAIETNTTLNNTNGEPIAFCLYRSDSGIELINQRVDLIMTRAIFEIEYFETL